MLILNKTNTVLLPLTYLLPGYTYAMNYELNRNKLSLYKLLK